MYGLNDKVVIITGCGNDRGLGYAMALAFASEKAILVPADIVSEGEMRAFAPRLLEAGAREVFPVSVDVSDEGAVKDMAAQAAARFGGIDVLVNNAGVMRVSGFLDTTAADFDISYNVMLKGTFLCTREVVKVMLDRNIRGKIVNMSSVGGKRPWVYSAAYCACKAGIVNLTQVSAAAFSKYGINVNGIAPGDHRSDMLELCYREGARIEGISAEEFRDLAIRSIPMGRLGGAGDVADMCLFLSSSRADFIAGQVVNVNGGAFMQ
jgi:NAD(P)-dependent dehydrogenase (short-subunit alcohol dehydrogenase family)